MSSENAPSVPAVSRTTSQYGRTSSVTFATPTPSPAALIMERSCGGVVHEHVAVGDVDVHAESEFEPLCIDRVRAFAGKAAGGKRGGVSHTVDEAAVIGEHVAVFDQLAGLPREVVHDRGIPSPARRDEQHTELPHAFECSEIGRRDGVVGIEKRLIHIAGNKSVHAIPHTT